MENNQERKVVTLSKVQEILASGKGRVGVQEYFQLSKKEMKVLFANPQLKHKRGVAAVGFDFVDDVTETKTNVEEAPVVNETPETNTNTSENEAE